MFFFQKNLKATDHHSEKEKPFYVKENNFNNRTSIINLQIYKQNLFIYIKKLFKPCVK